MQEAGIDSGMSRDSSTRINGYNGNWAQNSSDFSNIYQPGQLGYQVGFGTNSYSVFLRRDGTLPMTGSLNMDSNDIVNVKDLSGSGSLSMSGAGSFGGEVTATNGYGDKITLGGDAASSDYELRLDAPKPLSIFSPNVAAADRAKTTVFKTNGQAQIIGNALVNNSLATNGYSPTDMPAGWSGIRSADIVGSGTIAVLKNGTTGSANDKAFYATQYGNVYASNTITSGSWIWGTNGYGNQVGFGGDAGGNDYEIKMMTDEPLSIHMNSNRSDLTTLKVTGGIYTTGNIQTSGNLQLLNSVTYGSTCSASVGTFSRDSSGTLLSCIGGVWQYQSNVIQYQEFNGINIADSSSYAGCAIAVPYSKVQSYSFTSSASEIMSASLNIAGPQNNNSEITVCVFVDNLICAADSKVMGYTSGNASCMKRLSKGNHTITFVVGHSFGVSRFLGQYLRQQE